jgi:hypothetical protein
VDKSETGSANFFGPVQACRGRLPRDLAAVAAVAECVGEYRISVFELEHDLVADPDTVFEAVLLVLGPLAPPWESPGG